jgi:thymidylate kinase
VDCLFIDPRSSHAFFERVRAAYARIAQEEPGRVKRIDGSASIERIRKELEKHLELAPR